MSGNAFQARDIDGDVYIWPPPLPANYESRRNTLVITAVLLTLVGLTLLGIGIFGAVPVLSYIGGTALLGDFWCLWELWRHTASARSLRKQARWSDA